MSTIESTPTVAPEKKEHWRTRQKREQAEAGTPPSPKAEKPVKAKETPSEAIPEYEVVERKKDEVPLIHGQTHTLIIHLGKGHKKFAFKGKPSDKEIARIMESLRIDQERNERIKAEAEQRHKEAVARMTQP